ncbi:MAG: hypothetical protein IKS41_01015 [Alphaproteobacteria bacterium]|nr:hypothetical protein [Alphaproteobacteria bacterium]
MSDAKKVTVLKRTENGKLKSMIIFNSADEQAHLYFSDDEKLTRMVIGTGSRNLVAFDRVGQKYVVDPLTPGHIIGKEEEQGARWSLQGRMENYHNEFWLTLKDPTGQAMCCIDPATNEPTDQSRCFVNAWESGIRFQNAQGLSAFQIELTPEGGVRGFRDKVYGEKSEIIEQEVLTKESEEKVSKTLLEKEFERRHVR